MSDKEPMGSCDICGKDMFDGDKAFATTTGNFKRDVEGFAADENNWLDVVCSECGNIIGDAISRINVAGNGQMEEAKPDVIAPGWPERCSRAIAILGDTNSKRIFVGVIDVLQDADEMGGVADSSEYVRLMQAVIDECQIRMVTCKTTLK